MSCAEREEYILALRPLGIVKVKHDMQLQVYQLTDEYHEGLNNDDPKALIQNEKLTEFVAYYFARAITMREFLLAQDTVSQHWCGEAVLATLALDSLRKSEAVSVPDKLMYEQHSKLKMTVKEIYKKATSFDEYFVGTTAHLIWKMLSPYTEFFESTGNYQFLNQAGKEKLKKERPDIWVEFDLDSFVETTQSK